MKDADEILIQHCLKHEWCKVTVLIDHGANVNATIKSGHKKGQSVLWLAANDLKWDLVNDLIQKNADTNATAAGGCDKGKSILWIAISYRKWDLVADLIRRNADINATSISGADKGKSILWFAANYKQWGLVADLIQKGANINAIAENGPHNGTSILWLAASSNQWDLAENLIQNPNIELNPTVITGPKLSASILWYAVVNERWNIIGKLIENGADINATPKVGANAGQSILWHAVNNCNWPLTEYLIQSGADINTKPMVGPNKGTSVILLVANHKQWLLAVNLIKNGAEIHEELIENNFLKSRAIFCHAASCEEWGVVGKFLEKGCNPLLLDLSIITFIMANVVERRYDNNFLMSVKRLKNDDGKEELKKILISSIEKLLQNNEYGSDTILHKFFPQQMHVVKCQEYVNVQISEQDIIQICYDNFENTAQKSIIRNISEQFRNEDRSFKDILSGPFFEQVDELMNKYANQTNNERTKESLKKFAILIRNPSHFNSDNPKFYTTMKQNLEEILTLLTRCTESEKGVTISELSRQLLVCGPGIFNSILQIRTSLEVNDIKQKLAEYRKDLVLQTATVSAINNHVPAVMLIHNEAAHLMIAQQLGYAPAGGAVQLEHGDTFVNLQEGDSVSEIIKTELSKIFAEKYTLPIILEHIAQSFKKAMLNIKGNYPKLFFNNAASEICLDFKDYNNYHEQITQIAQQHGLTDSNGALYPELIDFNDDYTLCKIYTHNVKIFLLQSLIRLSIIEPIVQEVTIDSRKISFAFIKNHLYKSDNNIPNFKILEAALSQTNSKKHLLTIVPVVLTEELLESGITFELFLKYSLAINNVRDNEIIIMSNELVQQNKEIQRANLRLD